MSSTAWGTGAAQVLVPGAGERCRAHRDRVPRPARSRRTARAGPLPCRVTAHASGGDVVALATPEAEREGGSLWGQHRRIRTRDARRQRADDRAAVQGVSRWAPAYNALRRSPGRGGWHPPRWRLILPERTCCIFKIHFLRH